MKIDCSCTIGPKDVIAYCAAHTVALSVDRTKAAQVDGALAARLDAPDRCTVVTSGPYKAIRFCDVHQAAYPLAVKLLDAKAEFTKADADAIEAARFDAAGGAAEVDSL